MHPLFHLIATQPQLLALHAEAYAELVADEMGQVATVWKRRAMLNVVALSCLGLAVLLAGVALLLWAVVPATQIHATWALIAVPSFPLAVSVWCLWAARRSADGSAAFDRIRQQMRADLLMLREVSVP